MTFMQLTGESEPLEVSVSSFLANLPELVGSMRRDPRCLVAICDFADFRYVQFWAEGDVVIAEVISNMYLTDEMALTSAQEDLLRVAGWAEPSTTGSPNWSQRITGAQDVGGLCRAVGYAVSTVLGQGASPELASATFRTFEVHRTSTQDMDQARHDSRRNRNELDDANWNSLVARWDEDFPTDGNPAAS
jgi:hypothetical protein